MYASKILVGIDGSANSTLALRWAIHHAAATSSEVEAVHTFFIPALAYSAPGFIPPEQLDAEGQAKAIFDTALDQIGQPDAAKVSLRVVAGYPPDVLAKAAEDPDVAMLAIGARGHGKIEELFLGSVSHSLTHRCHKPLVIIPHDWTSGDGRIVVGFDGTKGSTPALRWAAEFARQRDRRVQAVIVYQALGGDQKGKDGALTVLSEALARIDTAGVSVTAEAVEGHPAEVLLERAVGADLLVVGTRGLGRLREVVTGSVTHACAEHSPVPVAIIRNYPSAEG